MKLTFQPLTRKTATLITAWIYEPPYDIYGYRQRNQNSALSYLTSPVNRFFGAFHAEELVGFRSFGADGRVAGGDYDGRFLDTGGGLRPDLTGRGLGQSAIAQGLHFATTTYGTQRFRVTIAGFNLRAQKTCQRLGFKIIHKFTRSHDHKEFLILTLETLPSLTFSPSRS